MKPVRRAFTIVELLVVTGIMAMLFGLVLAVGRSDQGSSARRAAQEFASQLLAAQSRALGRPEGAAVIVEADDANVRMGTAFQEGHMPQPILVSVENGTLKNPPSSGTGYKLRFQMVSGGGVTPISPWLSLRDQKPSRRQSAGQTPANTIDVPPAADEAIVVCYPVRGTAPVVLAGKIAMDLQHSGVGDNPDATHGHGRFSSQAPIAVVFDQTGRVGEVIQQVGVSGPSVVDPIVPYETIYFFFANRDTIEDNTSLASDDSFWVAVNPQTGRINVSANVPTATGDLTVARTNARQAIAVGK